MNRRPRRSTHRRVTLWQRMPYAVQLAVTIVLSAFSFAGGYAIFTGVSGFVHTGIP